VITPAADTTWHAHDTRLLLPVIVLVTKKSELPLMRIVIPALAGLSVLHGLIRRAPDR
jgi:H+/gluconate symporter-like permease